KGDLDEAIGEFREAIRLQPDEFLWRNNLCMVYIFKQSWADVVATAQDVIRIKPDSAEAYCNLGQALKGLGGDQEAFAALPRGPELGSRPPGGRYPSAKWIKECEALAAAAEKKASPPPTELAPPPREVAPPPRPQD